MQKEAKKHKRYTLYAVRCPAFTLVELILVVGMIALVAGALTGLVRSSYEGWELGSDRSTLLQDGRAVIGQMVRILRQAKAFSAVSSPTDEAGYITFTNVDDVTEEFRLNTGTGEIEYGQPGALSALAGAATRLVFTCYDIDANSLADPVSTGSIQSVNIEATFVDPQDGSINFTLSNRVFCQKDFPPLSVVINEIMYNPPGGSDAPAEWVELYNTTDSDVNLADWTIWTNNPGITDQITAHPQFGNGSTTISAGGYAVITAQTTQVYTESVDNGGFETGNLGSWSRHSSWSRSKWNAHGGSWKLESDASGDTWAYQDISVPAALNSCLFVFWEMTTAPVGQTQITVTIRNLSDQVLATGYSGQMHSDWTCHTMDLTAYAGQDVRIHFATTKTTSQDVLLLDDVSVAYSYVDIDATRLSVDDNVIGNGLTDNGGTVAIGNGSATIDSVTYDDSWGGDGDGTSLARIDPEGVSNDPANWQSGPTNGTPGSAN
jgi:hypothetical protein